ncbi:901_t:CDS:2 [Entrophospora sp. SA101]|nr:901_t:CDS:2 [Entrophospora sp. SA101]
MVHNYQKKIDELLKKARSQDSSNIVKTSIATGKLSPEKSQQLLEDAWSSNSKVGVGNGYNLVVNSRKRKSTKISKIHKILKPSRINKKRILFPKGSNTSPKSPEYYSDLDVNASNNSISTRALNTRKKLRSREFTPEKISRNQEETPTNANILENYFHSEGKHQKANRSIRTFTEDNIDDASPDTKSILTLAKNCNSDDGFNLLLQNYQMENETSTSTDSIINHMATIINTENVLAINTNNFSIRQIGVLGS